MVRPLPDERPRQSVANLIGRFEQQTKRPSASSPTPRSSSVVSHTTGDSTKEELKERREWPPRSISATSENTGESAAKEEVKEKKEWPPRVVAARGFNEPALTTEQPNMPEDETQMSPGSKSSSQTSPLSQEPLPESNPSVPDLPEQGGEVPVAKPVSKRQRSTESNLPPRSSNGPSPQATPVAKIPASRSAPITSMTKSPPRNAKFPKTPGKAPPSFTKSMSLQPLKMESHDRRSTSSVTPTATTPKAGPPARTSRPSSRTTIRSKTPSATAPSLPKTPSSKAKLSVPPVPKTPASALRPKTPADAVSRTPSTGLYAPTAASLAKARNAQPPQPERKKTLSSSISLDRLSKPTAASLSKVRTPVVVTSPARKSTTLAKPRASAFTRMKSDVTKENVAGGLEGDASGVHAATIVEVEGALEVEHLENGHTSDGHDRETLSDSAISHPEIILSDVEGIEHEDENSSPHEGESQHAVEEPLELRVEELVEVHSAPEDDTIIADTPPVDQQETGKLEDYEKEHTNEENTVVSPPGPAETAPELNYVGGGEQSPEASHHEVEQVEQKTNDIEDIVNLLESNSFSTKVVIFEPNHIEPVVEVVKPGSVAAAEHAGEIPDEE